MRTVLVPIDASADREDLVSFLTTNSFPFHVGQTPSAGVARARVDSGVFDGADNRSYWILDGRERVGFVLFEDVSETPLIDLRIAEDRRGKGLGTLALREATARVFAERPALNRIEGNARVDNAAMRAVFAKCGYVKESHYREGWPVEGAPPMDSVGYAILRRDWATGTTTPVRWSA